MSECIFCKIVNKELEASLVFENDSTVVFKSKFPVSETHVLIVPKKHISTFLDLDDKTIIDLKNAAKEAIKRLEISDGYKLAINGGKYQMIPHFHWHLLAGRLENEKDVLNQT